MKLRLIILCGEFEAGKQVYSSVDWKSCGAVFAGVAENADSSRRLLVSTLADIAIVDAGSLQKAAFPLISELRKVSPHTLFIPVNGAPEYDSVIAALHCGAFDYLAAGSLDSELNSVISKAAELIYQSRHTLLTEKRQMSIYNYLNGDVGAESPELKRLFNWGEGKYRAFVLRVSPYSSELFSILKFKLDVFLRPLCIDMESVSSSNRIYTLMNYSPDSEAFISSLLFDIGFAKCQKVWENLDIESLDIVAGIGAPADSLEGLLDSYTSAREIIQGRIAWPEVKVFDAMMDSYTRSRDSDLSLASEDKSKIRRYVESLQINELSAWYRERMRSIEEELAENPAVGFQFAAAVVAVVVSALDGIGISPKKVNTWRANFYDHLEECNSLEDIADLLDKIMRDFVSVGVLSRKENSLLYVTAAKQYILEHYRQDVTLELIAKRINISPEYLSRLFKEETGENYSEYLTSVRINEAKALLNDAKYNISDVASLVGFNSPRYFSKRFFALTGLQPSEYRRLHQQ